MSDTAAVEAKEKVKTKRKIKEDGTAEEETEVKREVK